MSSILKKINFLPLFSLTAERKMTSCYVLAYGNTFAGEFTSFVCNTKTEVIKQIISCPKVFYQAIIHYNYYGINIVKNNKIIDTEGKYTKYQVKDLLTDKTLKLEIHLHDFTSDE